jgi:hypothetical protein
VNKVRLTLSTHSEGGLTDADRSPARRIDEVTGAEIPRQRWPQRLLRSPRRPDERRRRIPK